jgi:cell division septation protein DedD
MVPGRDGPFGILCGSFRSAERAGAEVARLTAGGHAARSIAVLIPDRGVWHRVLVGRHADEEAAQAQARALITAGAVESCQIVAGDGSGTVLGRPLAGGSR